MTGYRSVYNFVERARSQCWDLEGVHLLMGTEREVLFCSGVPSVLYHVLPLLGLNSIRRLGGPVFPKLLPSEVGKGKEIMTEGTREQFYDVNGHRSFLA